MSLRGRADTGTGPVSEARFLVVACGRTPVALPAELVRGILQPEEAPAGGSVTVQGTVYPMVHLAERWDWPPSEPTADRRVILCADGFRAQGLIVDRVVGLVDVPRNRLAPLPLHFSGTERSWIAGMFLFEETVALVAHTGCLFDRTPAVKPQPVLEPPPPPTAESAPLPAPAAVGVEAAEPVEAEEVNLADQLDLEPLGEAGDAEDAPWADL